MGIKFKDKIRYKSKITYYTFGKKNYANENDLCFSLETINGNEYISKITGDERVLNDDHTY